MALPAGSNGTRGGLALWAERGAGMRWKGLHTLAHSGRRMRAMVARIWANSTPVREARLHWWCGSPGVCWSVGKRSRGATTTSVGIAEARNKTPCFGASPLQSCPWSAHPPAVDLFTPHPGHLGAGAWSPRSRHLSCSRRRDGRPGECQTIRIVGGAGLSFVRNASHPGAFFVGAGAAVCPGGGTLHRNGTVQHDSVPPETHCFWGTGLG